MALADPHADHADSQIVCSQIRHGRDPASPHVPRGGLGAQAHVGDVDGVLLRHESLAAVGEVGDELLAPVDHHAGDVDAPRALAVDHDEVLGTLDAGDVDVGPRFDRALEPDDREAAVAPRAEPLRRQIVEPMIAHHPRSFRTRPRRPQSVIEPMSCIAGWSGDATLPTAAVTISTSAAVRSVIERNWST